MQRSLIGALAAAFLLAVLAPISASVLGEPALVPLLLLFAASLPIRPLVAFGVAALQSKGHFAALAAALLAGAAVQAAVSLALAAGGAGAESLVLGAIGQAAVLAVIGATAVWRARTERRAQATVRERVRSA